MELAQGGINFELSLTMQFVQMRADAEAKAAHSNSVGIEHIFLGLLKLAELRADDLFNAPDFIIKTMSEDISVIRGMFAAAQIDTSRTRALLRYMAGSSTTSDEEALEKCCIIAMNNAKDRHSTAIWAQDMLSAIMENPTDMILQVCPVQRDGKIAFAEEKPIENTSADEMSKEFLPDLTNRIRRMRAQLLSKFSDKIMLFMLLQKECSPLKFLPQVTRSGNVRELFLFLPVLRVLERHSLQNRQRKH